MRNWPDLLQDAIADLRTPPYIPSHAPFAHPTHQLAFNAISHLWATIQNARADMVRSNVMVASMFMKYLMDGHLDLPPTLTEFYETVCGGAAHVPANWDREKKVIQRLRLPLQMALAISPLTLLLPTRLAAKDFSRDKLLNVSPILILSLI
jgi:hypothetical protein